MRGCISRGVDFSQGKVYVTPASCQQFNRWQQLSLCRYCFFAAYTAHNCSLAMSCHVMCYYTIAVRELSDGTVLGFSGDTIQYDTIYLRTLESRRYGQFILVHGTETEN